MTINETTGEISWLPDSAGTFDVTVQATNAAGSDTQEFSVYVTAVPDIISTPNLSGEVGTPYSYTVVATGEPAPTYTLTIAPPDMTIDEVSGAISWTPSAPGLYDVTVEAVNTVGSDTQSFTISVSSVCPAGIVSYWRLDETSGTQFSDYVGSNDATFSGTGSPVYAVGQVNGAVDFDGIDHRLATTSTSNPQTGLTVMAWINPEDLTAPDRGILSKKDAFVLDIESEGDKVSFVVIDADGYQEFEPDVPQNVVQADQWTFVAATFDGASQQMSIYVNGTEVGSTTTTISALGDSAEPYNIGLDTHFGTPQPDRYFDGRIDEVAVFDRALSTSEIQLQYGRTLAGEGYCDAALSAPDIVSTPATQVTIEQEYTYDVDAAGNPDITYSILPDYQPAGMSIDPVTGLITWTPSSPGDYEVRVRATNSQGWDQQNFTIQVAAIEPQIVSSPLTTAVRGLEYTYDVNATGVPTPTYTLTQNPPGMVIDSQSGVITWTPTVTGNVDVTVEATNVGGTDSQSFIISVQEPNSICPSNMVSYWRLDETSGVLFADSYGIADATFSGDGSPIFVDGQVEGALDFTGTNQKLATANTGNPTSALTVMAWINADDLDVPDRGILSKDGAFSLEIESDGDKVSFAMINGAVQEFEPNVPANLVQVNTWTHVAATFDGASATIFINGQVISTTNDLAINTLGSDATPYNIGWNAAFGTDRFFDGTIDEVAVFDDALSQSDVQTLYENSLIGESYCEVAPQITSAPVTSVNITDTYSYDVEATGNPAPVYSLEQKPETMTISETTGVISWSPTSTGEFDVSVTAQNVAGSSVQAFTITVASAPEITSTAVTNVALGHTYIYNVHATGYPTPTYTLITAPTGMTINESTGEISWVPNALGIYDVTVQAENFAGTTEQDFQVTVTVATQIFLPSIVQ